MDLIDFCNELADVLQRPLGSITPDTAFADIPKFDSAAQIELILLLDERYGIQLPEDTLPHLTYVRDLAPLIEQLHANHISK